MASALLEHVATHSSTPGREVVPGEEVAHPITRSPDHPITRSPDHPIADHLRSPDHPIIDHPITRSPPIARSPDHLRSPDHPDHPITRSPQKPPPVLSASRKQSNLVGNIRLDIKKGKLFSKGVPIHEVLREAEAKLFELRASEQSEKLRAFKRRGPPGSSSSSPGPPGPRGGSSTGRGGGSRMGRGGGSSTGRGGGSRWLNIKGARHTCRPPSPPLLLLSGRQFA